MAAPTSPVLQIAGAPARAGRASGGLLDLRVSDAERAEVADQLSRHYGAGRLDDAEFSARLDRVMAATTYRDLAGVLQDLPDSQVPGIPAGPPPPALRSRARPRRGRALLRVALLALLVIFAAAAARAVAWALAPVLWIGVLCAIVFLAARARGRR
jgi:hypothetical protein